MNPDSLSSFSHENHEEQIGDASLNQEILPVDSSLYNPHLNSDYTGGADTSETVAEVAQEPEASAGLLGVVSFQSIGIAAIIILLLALYLRISKILKILAPESAKSVSSKKTIHPGMSNEQFIALASAAATHLLQPIHPGLDNDRFIALISAATMHVLGGNIRIVKFKPMNAMDWTWVSQGRAELQNHKI